MIFLLGSILFSAFLTIGFKICQRFNIDTFQTIIVNYLTCILTGYFFGNSHPFNTQSVYEPWLPWAIILGCCFITFFNLTALTVKRSGVAIAGVATKISLVIPFLFSVLYFGETVGLLQWIGVALALTSVVLTCYQPSGATGHGSVNRIAWLIPIALFAGTGFQDAMIKFAEHVYVQNEQLDAFLITCFIVAFGIGSIILCLKLARGSYRLQGKAALAGIFIGIPNYFSIWCLISVLKLYPSNSSLIIPVNNIAIVLVNALAGFFIFREHLSKLNIAGIVMAIVAILLITS